MKVLKFGGTSVGTVEAIDQTLQILIKMNQKGEKFAVVFSAMGGLTNLLIAMSQKAAEKDKSYTDELKSFESKHFEVIRSLLPASEQSQVLGKVKGMINDLDDVLQGVFLIGELSKRSLDFVISHGERLNTFILSHIARFKGLETEFIDTRELVKTNSNFGYAKVNFELTNANIKSKFKALKGIGFVTGFIASDENNNTTTLGRGGSDYTAAIFAAALDAKECEIWTDVDGVMTADPRKVKSAFSLDSLSYSEAMEMSHFGAKVIYPPTLQPVFIKKIPIRIRNTFNPDFKGTLISEKSSLSAKLKVKGISSINDVSLLTLQGSGMIGVTGVASRLFGCLARAGVNVILITQASSEHSISFAINPEDAPKAQEWINEEFYYEINAGKIDAINIKNDVSVVAIIGENMINSPGICGRMFSALGKNGINIVAIAQGSSELNISTVIEKKDLSKALNALHNSYFLGESSTLNLFILGPGLIGGTLMKQIAQQQKTLLKKLALNLKVIAVANSKTYYAQEEGIELLSWPEKLEKSKDKMSLRRFVDLILELNLPNSVFVDNTSNQEVAEFYEELLKNSVSIVTPNKVANSGSFSRYESLQKSAKKSGAKFLYETNVGAGLPVINTLQGLINSGDDIIKIEGVLSGTLSYIFNTYNGKSSFKDVVLKAKELGFTEPDPRDDLNGKDVARKILILARESGYSLEMEDIEIEQILPPACIKAKSVEDFFIELEKADTDFKEKIEKSNKEGKKLCFIASLEKGKAKVSLQSVDSKHPFFSLAGSDNMISFTTARYKSNPLVIKGPGAGAEVTAAGVFADIIRIATER